MDYFKEEYEEQLLASSMILSDKRRLQYIRLNKESKAEEEANKTYSIKTKKKTKNNCDAPKCIIRSDRISIH